MSDSEMDLANIVHFDSYRAYRWLVTIADPDVKLYDYLRAQGVDVDHVINLLDGAPSMEHRRARGGMHFPPPHG